MSSIRGLRRLCAMGSGLLLAVALAVPASATPDTLKRSVENMTQFPLDIVTAPIVAGKSIYQNMQEIDDSPGVRAVYPIPGWGWNTVVQWGASMIRGVTGVIEFVPGLVLFFTDAELDPLFDPAEENDALVDFENGIYDVKFGIDYTTPGY